MFEKMFEVLAKLWNVASSAWPHQTKQRITVYRRRHKHRQRIKRFKATKKKHTLTYRTFRSTDDDERPTTMTDILALLLAPSRTKMRRTYGDVARVNARYAHCPSVSGTCGESCCPCRLGTRPIVLVAPGRVAFGRRDLAKTGRGHCNGSRSRTASCFSWGFGFFFLL